MRKFGLAAFYSALFTMFGGSIYYLFALVDALANGKDVVAVFVNTVVGCFILWALGTYAFYQINEAFEEMNRTQRQEYEERVRQRELEETQRREQIETQKRDEQSDKTGQQ